MLENVLKTLSVLIYTSFLILNTIKANCMSARSTSTDADCYLNHLARENVMTMGLDGGCSQPRQQVVYPDDNTKMFMPRGTILFRCNDQSGCCPQKEHSCQPVQEEDLRVAFYTMDCNAGDSRPQPEYLVMKNHTKCGCRPPIDGQSFDSPQRLQDMVCGGRNAQQSYGQKPNYGQVSGNGQSRGYGQSSPTYGTGNGHSVQNYGQGFSQTNVQKIYGQSDDHGLQQYGHPQQQQHQQQQQSPCSTSMSSRPLIDGQVVRGTIRLTVGPKGFSMQNQQQQQQPCPFG